MKPKHKRLLIILLLLAVVSGGFAIMIRTFNDNLVYFYSPTDLVKLQSENPTKFAKISQKKIRVGGLIENNSLKKNKLEMQFTVTDNSNQLKIMFTGIAPPMFREGQGVVAEGKLSDADAKVFIAENLITKHDEKYMPPEVHDALKANENK